MKLTFQPLSRENAKAIVSRQYAGEYSTYNTPASERKSKTEYLLDPRNRFFAACRDAELEGFCSIGPDGQVGGGSYDESAVDLGAGMRPDLVGQGNGVSFLRAVLTFVESESGRLDLRATIASSNERALRAVRASGFADESTFTDHAGRQFTIMLRRKPTTSHRK